MDAKGWLRLIDQPRKAAHPVNRYRFVDRSATRQKPRVSWFFFKQAPKPVDVEPA